MDAVTGCPDDYDELYRAYYPLIVSVVRKAGIVVVDVEDVAMEILVKFIEKNGIEFYDPGYVVDTGENPEVKGQRFRRPKFSRMLYGFASTYVLQWRDKQKVKAEREVYCLDTPLDQQEEASPEIGDLLLKTEETTAEVDMHLAVVSSIQQAMAILRETKATKVRDYDTLVVAFVQGCWDTGKHPVRRELVATTGISRVTVQRMVEEFINTLHEVVETEGVYAA